MPTTIETPDWLTDFPLVTELHRGGCAYGWGESGRLLTRTPIVANSAGTTGPPSTVSTPRLRSCTSTLTYRTIARVGIIVGLGVGASPLC